MLDDIKIIHTKDPQDALGFAEKQWQQLDYEFELNGSIDSGNIQNIVFSGMGGSALSALIFLLKLAEITNYLFTQMKILW